MLWRAEVSTWHDSSMDLILLMNLTQQEKNPANETQPANQKNPNTSK